MSFFKEVKYILIQNQKIEVVWNNHNREWYENLGYTDYKWGKKIIVNADELSHGSSIRVNVLCDYCGESYDVAYYAYYQSHQHYPKDACHHCGMKKAKELTYEKRKKKYFDKLESICLEKGYKLITNRDEYVNVKMRIEYECPKHGIKTSNIDNFIRGHGCIDCKNEQMTYIMQTNTDEIEKFINSCNNNKLLNKFDFKSVTDHNLQIQCKCGNIYETSFVNFKKHGVQQCRSCSSKQSKNESFISSILDKMSITYITEKRFQDCRDKKPLPFDFYLPDYDLCIEYDGEGHYLESFYDGYYENPKQELLNRQYKDSIKTNYCKTHNINLLRIPYWKQENIQQIIIDKLNTIKIYKQVI